MSNSTGLLDEAFKDALLQAATQDQQGITEDDDDDLFAGPPASNVELVQECLDFYHQHQVVIDAAVQGTLKFLESPHGVAHVKTLEASFESPEPNPLSVELASDILNNADFAAMSSLGQAQNLKGIGIGFSAGANAFAGPLAGADIVFDFHNKNEVFPRKWIGHTIKAGLSVSAGLELSFWVKKPLTGRIRGWLIDLYVPIPPVFIILFIRFMYIKATEPGSAGSDFSGVSLQFPLGAGLPIRWLKKKAGLVARFAALQRASARVPLKVVDKATGMNSIPNGEAVTLAATLNNWGEDVALSAGATMTIQMPSYFTSAEVRAMNIADEEWTFAHDGDKLKLTLSKALTWRGDAEISFEITNVQSSAETQPDKKSERVTLTLNDPSFKKRIATVASLNLVGVPVAGIDDALYSGAKSYFFSGTQYIRVTRDDSGAGTVDPGYPKSISDWGWGEFGRNGIDAALYSGAKSYFFSGNRYIRVTRDDTGPGTVDRGYPKFIADLRWGDFGGDGIDAALYSGAKCYFFSGDQYIRATLGEDGPGTIDPGYPAPISDWGWGDFGQAGIDAALYSGAKCYFFSGDQYIRVTRGETGAGTVDHGYPKPISAWGWPESFYASTGDEVDLPPIVES